MEIKKSSRERLLEESAYLFRVNGYHNTSIADIAEACKLRKASIYHHITSKKELGIAVLEQTVNYFSSSIYSIAYDNTKSVEQRLNDFSTAIEDFYIGRDGGCMVGNFALEVLNTVPEFESLIKEFFDGWIKAVTHLLSHKYDESEAKKLALDTTTITQGAIMMSRLYKTYDPLKRLRSQMINLLNPSANFNSLIKTSVEN